MIAVIKTGGKQYVIQPGMELKVEKLDVEVGKTVTLTDVLLVDEKVGTPLVAGAKVIATVLENGQGKKVTGVKFHNKVRYRRTFGHRQEFTKLKIDSIA
jgi:large subunit ribosomal protein L21